MFVCADGGAKRLFDKKEWAEENKINPSHIIGDLDSCSNEVLNYFKYKGT